MFCKYCGEFIDADSIICKKCGKQIKNDIKKNIAKEIIVNTKLLGLAILLTIIFCICFYIKEKPYYGHLDSLQYSPVSDTTSSRIMAEKEAIVWNDLGDSKYDGSFTRNTYEYSSYRYSDIKEVINRRKENFLNDLKNKTFLISIIIISTLIIGRYFIKFRLWLIKNSK
jgi:hypothetical protein